MSDAPAFSIDDANAGKGVAVPGIMPLADTGSFRNPYLAPRSGFDTLVTLRGDGLITFEAVHRLDPSVGFACQTPLSELNMSYEKVLQAFAMKKARAAKIRQVRGRAVLFIGAYAARRFVTLEAQLPMEPIAADARPAVLARIHRYLLKQLSSRFQELEGAVVGAGAVRIALGR